MKEGVAELIDDILVSYGKRLKVIADKVLKPCANLTDGVITFVELGYKIDSRKNGHAPWP